MRAVCNRRGSDRRTIHRRRAMADSGRRVTGARMRSGAIKNVAQRPGSHRRRAVTLVLVAARAAAAQGADEAPSTSGQPAIGRNVKIRHSPYLTRKGQCSVTPAPLVGRLNRRDRRSRLQQCGRRPGVADGRSLARQALGVAILVERLGIGGQEIVLRVLLHGGLLALPARTRPATCRRAARPGRWSAAAGFAAARLGRCAAERGTLSAADR